VAALSTAVRGVGLGFVDGQSGSGGQSAISGEIVGWKTELKLGLVVHDFDLVLTGSEKSAVFFCFIHDAENASHRGRRVVYLRSSDR